MREKGAVGKVQYPQLAWEELLDELFHSVLSKLRGNSVGRVRGVCSSWKCKAHRLLDKIVFQTGSGMATSQLIKWFPALIELKIEFLGQDQELTQLTSLSKLLRLSSLDLSNQEEPGIAPVVDIGSLKALKSLESLTLRRCKLTASSGLQEVVQLKSLHMSQCFIDLVEPSLGKVLSPLKGLNLLHIEKCLPRSRASIRGLKGLTSLRCATLHIPLAGYDDLALELSHLPYLTILDISSISCPTLASITNVGLDYLASLTQLKCLRLGGHYGISNIGKIDLNALEGLTELDLSIPGPLIEVLYDQLHLHHRVPTDAGLCHLAGLRHLASLTISYTYATNGFVCQLLQSLNNLEHLNISHCAKISDAVCFGFGGHRRITSLNLSSCHISDKGLFGLSRSAPNLKKLNLSGSHETISDQGLRQLCKLPKLYWLSLAHCEEITDFGIEELVSNLFCLDFLSLKGCAQVTDLAIIAVARHLHHLRTLELGYPCRITDSAAYSAKSMRELDVVYLSNEVFSVGTCKMLTENGIDVPMNRAWWM